MRVTRTLRATVGAALTGALLLSAGGTASADQVRKGQWPLEAFGAQQLWKEATGKGVTVAVLDSGFRTTHQDLTGQFLPGPDFGKATEAEGAKYLKPNEDIRDHGTAMAGIIAGHGHGPGGSEGVKGLAPDAKILPVPEYKNSGQATRWAVEHGADVINMSYGGDLEGDTCESIHYALDKGVVVVAAVGNDGLTRKTYPVGCPGVIGVGSVDQYGKAADANDYNADTDLLAPGEKVAVAMGKSDHDYDTAANGSSAATAYVSAAAALLKQKFPDLTPGQIANRLVKTAGLAQAEKAKHLKLPDAHYGYGFIQPGPALRQDIAAGPAAGPLPMPKGKYSDAAADKGSDPNPPMGGKQTALLIGGIALGVLVVAGIVIGVVVSVRRRNKAGNQTWG